MLFGHRNTWNTCLLILRERGYRLFLLGPNDPELLSDCTWNAEKDGIKLRASNPIELLGLAMIHEHRRPTADIPYWWRIDGPNLVRDLQAAWQSQLASIDRTAPEVRYEDASYAYCGGNFEVAAALFSELVREGHIGASIGLAEMYLRGEGVETNVEKGLELLRQAAAAGSETAAFNLGARYRTGADHVPVDPAASRYYFLLARELGCTLPIDDYLKSETKD